MSSKKRKQANTGNGVEIPSKRSKQDGKRDKKSKKVTVGGAGFHVVKASLVVSIPPIFASTPRAGVEEMLDSMIMRSVICLSLYCTSLKALRLDIFQPYKAWCSRIQL